MKRGITLVELLVSMTIIVIIMVVVTSVYSTASQNYLHQGAKSQAQREINTAADQISRAIKEAASAPDAYEIYLRDTNPDDVLILGLPARDNNNNFQYAGEALILDYYVYRLSSGEIKRKIFADPAGNQSTREITILSNVSNFACTETPSPDFLKVQCELETTKIVRGRDVKVNATVVANLRNE